MWPRLFPVVGTDSVYTVSPIGRRLAVGAGGSCLVPGCSSPLLLNLLSLPEPASRQVPPTYCLLCCCALQAAFLLVVVLMNLYVVRMRPG